MRYINRCIIVMNRDTLKTVLLLNTWIPHN